MGDHDLVGADIGLAYRPDEGVDFQAPEAGLYTSTPYVVSVPGSGSFRVRSMMPT